MAQAWNGRIYDADKNGKNFEIVWDGQLQDWDLWAIPKGDRKHSTTPTSSLPSPRSPKPRRPDQLHLLRSRPSWTAIPNVPPAILQGPADGAAELKNVLVNDAQFWGDNGEDLGSASTPGSRSNHAEAWAPARRPGPGMLDRRNTDSRMVSLSASLPVLRTADGVPLKVSLRRAERRSKLRAFALVMPLMLFIFCTFALPIGFMLYRAVDNPEIVQNLPRTTAAIATWNGQGLPDEPSFAALAADLKEAQKTRNTGLVGKRLNYEMPGVRSKVIKTGRDIERVAAGP